jgi:hypothetical protein
VINVENVEGLTVSGLQYPAGKEKILKVAGSRTQSINLVNEGPGVTMKNVEILADVPKGAVQMK